jgi:alpha-tubulin suppressor-like RCC1 family protein
VEGIDHVDSIGSGSTRSCAIRSDRSVWCWGDSIGAFAIGSPVPVQNDWR